MGEGYVAHVGVDLFDDGVGPVGLLRLQHGKGRVGEHGVVAVGGEQFALAGGDAGRVQANHPAHGQARPVTCSDLRREVNAGVRDLGDLRVGDEPLLLLVPDRVRVVDRHPGRVLDARDRPTRGPSGR